MIPSTDRMEVSHVYERTIHKFLSRDKCWSVNFINSTDPIIDDEKRQSEGVVILKSEQAHSCQEIEVI